MGNKEIHNFSRSAMTEFGFTRNLGFSLVFSNNDQGISPAYNLLWVPVPVWHKTEDESWQVNPYELGIHNGPEYCLGYLKPLIDSEGLNPDTYSSVFVCVHKYDSELPLDSGTEEDLEKIIQDLQDNKFKPIVCRSN